MAKPIPIQPILDGGWKYDEGTSKPTRGLRDYNRIMTFNSELTIGEIDRMCAWLQKNECPGWTPVRIQKTGKNVYTARTCMDSSD